MRIINNNPIDWHQLRYDLLEFYYKKIKKPELIYQLRECLVIAQATQLDVWISLRSVYNYFYNYAVLNDNQFSFENDFRIPAEDYSNQQISNYLFQMSRQYFADAHCDCKNYSCEQCRLEYLMYLDSFLDSIITQQDFSSIFEIRQDEQDAQAKANNNTGESQSESFFHKN